MSIDPTGPLALVIATGTVAMVALAVPVARELWRRSWRAAAWAVVPLALIALTGLGPKLVPWLHPLLATLTVVAAARNAWGLEGVSRWASVAGAVATLVSMGAAFAVFR